METSIRKYQKHKSSAKSRGIDFNLTFEEWYDIWQQSGHYNERGRGAGTYVMSRCNDTGAYEIGNVFVQLNAQNVIDAKNTGRKKGSIHTEETKKLFSIQRLGKTHSKEWADKISKSLTGIPRPQQVVKCPHCDKNGALNNMKRWHFDNCQKKEKHDSVFQKCVDENSQK